MSHLCTAVVRCWGTKPTLRLSGYLWVATMFGLLAALEANRIGVFLVSPFAATLTILMLLPDAPVAQPYALIMGSVCRAAVGTGASLLGSGLGTAVLAMIAAFVVISLIHAYHPPGVALASIPVLLHLGHWFPLLVVLPFTVMAVGSAAAMSKWLRGWPVYPRSLRDCAR
ncbi:MAG: HPP family protein [Candidatus Sulfotelmatobacter sp.]|jgi:CBS-domain-containing membrane protein